MSVSCPRQGAARAAGDRFGRVVHRGGGDTGGLQSLRRLVFVLAARPGSNDALQFILVPQPGRQCREA
jgi:hypothetical protein